MKHEDEGSFDEVSDEIAVPKPIGGCLCYNPKHGNDGEGKGEGDEECHSMMVVELVNNHQDIDVAERHKAEREDAKSTIAFIDKRGICRSKQFDDSRRPDPYEDAGHYHRYRDEAKRLPYYHSNALYIALPDLYGTKRLQGLTGA